MINMYLSCHTHVGNQDISAGCCMKERTRIIHVAFGLHMQTKSLSSHVVQWDSDGFDFPTLIRFPIQ